MVQENKVVRRFLASNAIAALLVGFVYAPLFHVHSGGDHDMEAPLVHAHFPEPGHIYAEHAFQPPTPHGKARSIDVFTASTDDEVQSNAVIVTDKFIKFDAGHTCCGFVESDTPRAHAPPPLQFRSPRAPPL